MATKRAALNRDRVLRAAMRLADEGGLDSLSMRRLGQTLGVEAMSLYNHVAGKDEILDGLGDLVMREFELPPPDGEWEASLRRLAISAHDALIRHPWAASLLVSPARSIPTRMRYIDAVCGCLRTAGFSPESTFHAYHAIDSHILGFTLWELGHALPDVSEDTMREFLRTLPRDEYPHLAEHVDQHLHGTNRDDQPEFEFGLDLVLDGFKRLGG
jgi:AcrR family transcriptional regulator